MTLSKMIVQTLKDEVKPAMGCTEPVAVALAVAKAKELYCGEISLENPDFIVDVAVSPNIFKNGLAVGIPGTDQVGLVVATALGIVACDSSDGLEIFKKTTKRDIKRAYEFINAKRIRLKIADTDAKIYIEVKVADRILYGKSIIEGRHDHFSLLETQDGIEFMEEPTTCKSTQINPLYEYPLYDLIQEVEKLPYEEIKFLLEGFEMNRTIAEYGLTNPCGLEVGRTLQKNTTRGILTDDLMNRSMILTAAASDARMSGVSLPVMSSNGSGNNGITALLPIVAYAKSTGVSDDHLARAAAISHLVNGIVKSNIGRLSALCGCGVAAGTGASVALTWLMGANQKQLEGAVQNMIANTTGMICDGAKIGCSLKLATSASAAVQSALLSMGGVIVPEGNGIIGKTANHTIKNLGVLSRHAMDTVDQVILNVMLDHVSE
ncbi:L-cysteine desulfidase family protein [Fusibacter bizertensis]